MTLRRPGQSSQAHPGGHRGRTHPSGPPDAGHYGPSAQPRQPGQPGQPGSGTSGARRSAPAGRRPRSGTEPVTARSALRARLILASIFTPVFVAATALFWYWTTQTGAGEAPSAGSLLTLTIACGLLALFSLVDLLVVLRRRRRESPPGQDRPDGGFPGRGSGPDGT
ncbi:DUF6343 family protein [Streptomyces ovatisporus]|uniref:DUF6343 family protein n=1 Tax=Streptomyces ovatisporus TaxID=1128682 RepID=A0ABV9AAP1_9ACTN